VAVARVSTLRLIILAAALAGCAPAATATSAPNASPSGSVIGPAPTASAAIPTSRPHIVVIMEENVGYKFTLGACGAGSPDPYLCSLAGEYASATDWFAVQHPSLPNYIDIISGGDQGCTDDGCTGPYSALNLGAQLSDASIPWVAYMESMPSACFAGPGSGEYAGKHDPFMVFADVARAASCSQVVQPYPGASGIAAALDSPIGPDFVWITPNLIDDMHDGTIQQGDAWLRMNLTAILGSTWFAEDGTVIISMDENDVQSTGSCCGDAAGGNVPEVVISASSRGRGRLALSGDHFGTLRTIEEAYDLPRLGAAANPANGDLTALVG
jgi:acid phosphatase